VTVCPAARAAAYARAFPRFPPLLVTDRWLYGVWLLGNQYRNPSHYYGAFPPSLLPRVWALFPEIAGRVLHVCSGSLTAPATAQPGRQVVRLDCQRSPAVQPSVQGDATGLPFQDGTFELLIADPPYGAAQAVHYGVPMPSRRRMVQEAWRVTQPGGCLVWLDTTLPMYRKAQWHLFGTIAIVRSTNHVVRLLSLFERV
jgi:hypothetical protein